jgi:hypothetical protein
MIHPVQRFVSASDESDVYINDKECCNIQRVVNHSDGTGMNSEDMSQLLRNEAIEYYPN